MRKKLSIMLSVPILLSLIAFAPPAYASTTLTATVLAPQGSNIATQYFNIPATAINIVVSVNTGTVQSQGFDSSGKYAVTVNNGSVTVPFSHSKYVEREHTNTRTQTYTISPKALTSTTYSWDGHDNHPHLTVNENGYTGNIPKWRVTEAQSTREYVGNFEKVYTVYTGHYRGEVTKSYNAYTYTITVTYDIPNGTLPTPPQEPVRTEITQVSLNITNGQMVYVPIQAINLPGGTETFTSGQLNYDSTKLTLIDLDVRTTELETTTNYSNDVFYITGLPTGFIMFNYMSETNDTGLFTDTTLTIVAFQAKASGTTVVSLS